MHPLYLDPGAGSALLQIAIAALAGLGLAAGAFWRKIARLFRKGKGDDDDEE